jgi:predicted phosphodiesterase
MTQRVAVLSDLHSNARALRAALERIHALGVDRVVVNGDLLTYGIDHGETLELVEAELARGAALTLGNHDQLYLDLADGNRAYHDALPAWLRESATQTFAAIDPARLRALPWAPEVVIGPVLVAHANPFAPRDWTYLNTPGEVARAEATLIEPGYSLGVFGHTHRARVQRGRATVCNAGSIGQPRSAERAATFLLLTIPDDGGAVAASIEPVHYDVDAHVRALRASRLSESTKARLCAFFTG